MRAQTMGTESRPFMGACSLSMRSKSYGRNGAQDARRMSRKPYMHVPDLVYEDPPRGFPTEILIAWERFEVKYASNLASDRDAWGMELLKGADARDFTRLSWSQRCTWPGSRYRGACNPLTRPDAPQCAKE